MFQLVVFAVSRDITAVEILVCYVKDGMALYELMYCH